MGVQLRVEVGSRTPSADDAALLRELLLAILELADEHLDLRVRPRRRLKASGEAAAGPNAFQSATLGS